MEKFIHIFILIFLALPVSAQTWESVKDDPTYYYGEGYGKTVEDADNNAMHALISKISVNISSRVSQTEEETVRGGNLTNNSDFCSKINTYAHATLTNTERSILEKEPNAHVARWIKRSEVEEIFRQRREKINSLIAAALKAEQGRHLDITLKSLRWSLALVNSLQRPNEAVLKDSMGNTQMLQVWIPQKMNDVLNNIQAKSTLQNGTDVELHFSYKGQPVASLGFYYFNGVNWSDLCKVKDSIATITLAKGRRPDRYQLHIAYGYRNEASADAELSSILEAQDSLHLPDAYQIIPAIMPPEEPALATTQPSIQKLSSNADRIVPEIATVPTGKHQHQIISDIQEPVTQSNLPYIINIKGITITMIPVEYSDGNYYIGKYEVTQGLWQAVMGSNPSVDVGYNLPVEQVSWNDCQQFVRRLNTMTGKSFRLPTEREWDYASRGGSHSQGYQFSGSNNIDNVAWYDNNSGGSAHQVGTKAPNELGIYDMSGNVWEWCQDNYIRKGGAWGMPARSSQVASRRQSQPDSVSRFTGLRLAMNH